MHNNGIFVLDNSGPGQCGNGNGGCNTSPSANHGGNRGNSDFGGHKGGAGVVFVTDHGTSGSNGQSGTFVGSGSGHGGSSGFDGHSVGGSNLGGGGSHTSSSNFGFHKEVGFGTSSGGQGYNSGSSLNTGSHNGAGGSSSQFGFHKEIEFGTGGAGAHGHGSILGILGALGGHARQGGSGGGDHVHSSGCGHSDHKGMILIILPFEK